MTLPGLALGIGIGLAAAAAAPVDADRTESWAFSDDFSAGLGQWRFPQGDGYDLVDTGDSSHGRALALRTAALQTHALIRDSASWAGVRIEGEVLFPENVHNYLGFIYRYVDDDRRIDFGSLYIKGNGSYLQANPHSDTNVGRLVYPERRAILTGDAAITIGEWQRFALEVVGPEAHIYVGESTTPQMTLRSPEADRGAFGFKPRHPGGAVWIDNIRARPIAAFSYRGPPQPDVPYNRDAFITDWRVLGPLSRMSAGIESGRISSQQTIEDDGREVGWREFPADHRGAVFTGRVTEYRGSRRVAYFHTVLHQPEASGGAPDETILEISTADPLALWLNGKFAGFAPAADAAWWDAGENPDHPPLRWQVDLQPGPNELLVRAVGGSYASGGFFMRLRTSKMGSNQFSL